MESILAVQAVLMSRPKDILLRDRDYRPQDQDFDPQDVLLDYELQQISLENEPECPRDQDVPSYREQKGQLILS